MGGGPGEMGKEARSVGFDGHVHFLPETVLAWLRQSGRSIDVRIENRVPGKEPFLVVEGKWAFELKRAFVDERLFLDEQRTAKVAHSLVSPIPQLFLYELDAAVTKEAASVYNDGLVEMVQRHGDRLSALATVPLNDPEAAAAELLRGMDRGLKGAIVGPGVGAKPLSDESLHPFWEAADSRGAIIFLHPLLSTDPRLKRPQMPNMIGVPWETTVAGADIVFSGMLDRFPRVKIMMAHGGGYLPYQIGRLNKAYDMWPAAAANLQAPPEQYLRRLWFDTVLWHEATFDYLCRLVGPERLVPGSDYPFDLSHWPPGPEAAHGHLTLMDG